MSVSKILHHTMYAIYNKLEIYFTNNYNLLISFTNSDTHILKNKSLPGYSYKLMLSTVYMLCNSLLFTPDRKTLQSTQNIQENHKEEFTWTKNVYTCIHVPEYLRLMISSLNKIRHQFFFSHLINYLVNLLIALFSTFKDSNMYTYSFSHAETYNNCTYKHVRLHDH